MPKFIVVRNQEGRTKAAQTYPQDFVDGGTTYESGAGSEKLAELSRSRSEREKRGDSRVILIDTGPSSLPPGDVLLLWDPQGISPEDAKWAAENGVRTLVTRALLPSDVS